MGGVQAKSEAKMAAVVLIGRPGSARRREYCSANWSDDEADTKRHVGRMRRFSFVKFQIRLLATRAVPSRWTVWPGPRYFCSPSFNPGSIAKIARQRFEQKQPSDCVFDLKFG